MPLPARGRSRLAIGTRTLGVSPGRAATGVAAADRCVVCRHRAARPGNDGPRGRRLPRGPTAVRRRRRLLHQDHGQSADDRTGWTNRLVRVWSPLWLRGDGGVGGGGAWPQGTQPKPPSPTMQQRSIPAGTTIRCTASRLRGQSTPVRSDRSAANSRLDGGEEPAGVGTVRIVSKLNNCNGPSLRRHVASSSEGSAAYP